MQLLLAIAALQHVRRSFRQRTGADCEILTGKLSDSQLNVKERIKRAQFDPRRAATKITGSDLKKRASSLPCSGTRYSTCKFK